MSKTTYIPKRGDVLHVNFQPSAGSEFTGPHFGLVISSLAFSKATGLCMVLPMTSKFHPDKRLLGTQLMVAVPELDGLEKNGWVYVHQLKTIDYRERGASFKTAVDEENLDFLIDVMERVRSFIDPDSVD